MGYRIDSYSLEELHRIAVPGTVTPSLFWVLPIGRWSPRDLTTMWQHFTEADSLCNSYGLLLVKDLRQEQSTEPHVDLGPVGARLQDVLPEGTERFVSSSAFRDPPRLLLLSGGYPQPGWGVLVEGVKDVQSLEGLVKSVNERLANDAGFLDHLHVIEQAGECFHRWRHHKQKSPPQPDVASFEREILDGERANSLLRNAQKAQEGSDFREAGENLFEAVRTVQQASWMQIPAQVLQQLPDNQRKLAAAVSILAVPAEVLAAEFKPKVAELIADPKKRGAIFKTLPTEELKNALKAYLYLCEKNFVGVEEDARLWAERTMAEMPARLLEAMMEISAIIAAKLPERRGSKAQLEREFEIATEGWRSDGKVLRENLHRLMNESTQIQWDLGPRFLVALEDHCREKQLWVRCIPWDPARMIGWKMMVRQVRLDVSDLQMVAREFVSGASIVTSGIDQQTGPVDGSYFTDYVHHIAISKPGVSPRDVTKTLVARLLRPTEICEMLRSQGEHIPEQTDAVQLADQLLGSFGWHEKGEQFGKTLASCIEKTDDAAWTLANELLPNDVRIRLESFCKDVIDLIVAQLGYRQEHVWEAIEERAPKYQPNNKDRDWSEEVAHMTVGSAVMLLSALGSLAFSTRKDEVTKLAASLNSLSKCLNLGSHHQEEEDLFPVKSEDAPEMIWQVLEAAKNLFGELPWHLNVSFVYGEQPKVMSGEAWSHGSSTPRFLRVIQWTGGPVRRQVLLWNKTRRNPIITDPVFIERPRKEMPSGS